MGVGPHAQLMKDNTMTDLEIVAAVIDGERVNSDRLAEALSAPEGREYLIDLLALRELVEERAPLASREIEHPMMRVRWPWLSLAAAVLAIATLAGGYAAGLREGLLHPSSRSVQVGAYPSSTAIPAPVPTRVIRLESGVTWQETIGGH